MEVVIYIEANVNPTESEEKVKKAVFNLFGSLPTEVKSTYKGSVLTAYAKGQETLSNLRGILARDRIRDASRKALRESRKGDSLTFYLNKQVAFAGHVSFSEAEAESPLGPIKVIIKCENPTELINWLAPRTIKP